jgi:hypothetical protein
LKQQSKQYQIKSQPNTIITRIKFSTSTKKQVMVTNQTQ